MYIQLVRIPNNKTRLRFINGLLAQSPYICVPQTIDDNHRCMSCAWTVVGDYGAAWAAKCVT